MMYLSNYRRQHKAPNAFSTNDSTSKAEGKNQLLSASVDDDTDSVLDKCKQMYTHIPVS